MREPFYALRLPHIQHQTPSGFTVQIHRQRKAVFPSVPRLSLALPHVVTLIIVFFPYVPYMQGQDSSFIIQPGNLKH